MTLDKITVKNFQSIDSGEVELGSFTVCVGPSSSGKSAFIRALHGVSRNSFTPAQVTVGKTTSEVTVEVDGHTVKAVRGKGKSTYILDGEEYTKAGRSVPEDIEAALSMPDISGVESTFATQFDKPYLIAESGSVASKVLGSLTNVSVLHKGLQETNRRGLDTRSRLKIKSSDLEDVETSLTQFEDLDSNLQTLNDITELDQTIDSLYAPLNRITSLIENLETLMEAAKNVVNIPEGLEQISENLSSLTPDVEAIISLGEVTGKIQSSLDQFPKWDYKSVPMEGLSISVGDILELTKHLSHIEEVKESALAQTTNVKEFSNKAKEIQGQYDSLLEGLEVCPLCNSAIQH